MAEQFRLPYGDAFIVQTPALDKWANQLYVEQKQREARQQQENAALDAGIQKEIGKIRSVDTPEVIQSYNDYKRLKSQLYFDKSLRKDPLRYSQLQNEANRAYQNVFKTINGSVELKDLSKNLTEGRLKDKNAYSDDSAERIATLMNTPLSKTRQHPVFGDLTNMEGYLYNGSNTDFGKAVRDAAGTPKQVYSNEKLLDGNLQFQVTPYMYGNSPAQVKDALIGSMAMRQSGRDAAWQWDQLPKQEIENTIKQYQAIPKEKWERMGLSGPQDLISKNPANKAENFASYLAMKYAINNDPREGTPVFRENKKAVFDLQFNKETTLEAIRHGNRVAEIKLRNQLKNKDEETQNSVVDDLYDGLVSTALKQRRSYKPASGKPYFQYEMQATEGVKKLFAKKDTNGHDLYPDQLVFSEDFKTVTPIFFKRTIVDDKDGTKRSIIQKNKQGDAEVIKDLSNSISADEFKENWKKELLGVGGYAKTTQAKKSTTPKFPLPKGKPRSVTQNGFTYTWDEATGEYK